MTRRSDTIPPGWFDTLYAGDPDPWRFASSSYEREKYAATLAALPPGRFASGLEIGCSIGVLTAQLAPRCDALLAIDVAEAALSQARARCPGVRFERRMVPDEFPPGRFDLIVCSEVLYYLASADLDRTIGLMQAAMRPGGCILAVHYLGGTDYPLTGDEAAERLIASCLARGGDGGLAFRRGFHARAPLYRLDRLDCAPAAG